MADMPRPPEPCDADFDIEQMLHHAEKIMEMGGPPHGSHEQGSGSWESG